MSKKWSPKKAGLTALVGLYLSTASLPVILLGQECDPQRYRSTHPAPCKILKQEPIEYSDVYKIGAGLAVAGISLASLGIYKTPEEAYDL